MAEYLYDGEIVLSTKISEDAKQKIFDLLLQEAGSETALDDLAPTIRVKEQDGRCEVTLEYHDEHPCGRSQCRWFRSLYENRGSISMQGGLRYCGSEDGRIYISDDDFENLSLEDMADNAEAYEREQKRARLYMVEHYRELVRNYFADTTEQGRIDKYARFEECEFIMKKLYQFDTNEIRDIYNQEYKARYGS